MRWRTVTVGLVTVALLATGCGVFGGTSGSTVRAEFERTFNLFPGSPVRILGIEVGLVRELLIAPGDDSVTAVLDIDEGVQLPRDVRAIIITDALLGERVVQLDPPYVAGPTFESGATIPRERTRVPAEFDEVLDALNRFAEGIESGDLPRLVDNLAEILDGNGENLGRTIDAARDALGVLRDNDEELVALARELADLNEVLNTRNRQTGELIADFAELSRILADQRIPLDQALSGLARLTDETGRLLEANRDLLEDDVATITRVGRTADRNVDQVSRMLLGSAELFRHAERVLDRERNWLPLVNNTDDLANFLLESIGERLASLCRREGVDTALCEQLRDQIDQTLPDQVCLPPLVSCSGGDDEPGVALGTALAEMGDRVTADAPEGDDEARRFDEFMDGVVEDLDDLFGGGGG